MKTTKRLLFFIAIALFTFSIASYGQQTHVITLNVDTGQIEKSNVDQVCDFGQDPGISNRGFTIEVEIGDTVKWIGVSSSSPETDSVEITSINHEGGARVFGKNKLNDTDGVVIGIVTDGKEGDLEKYKISFKVYNNGDKRGGTYHIDPIIKVGR